MPSSFNGIGTTYYGRREDGVDGSYITTEWFILVYIPIAPIASYRVRPTGGGLNVLVYSSEHFQVEEVPLNWRQVRNVYSVLAGAVATLVLLAMFA